MGLRGSDVRPGDDDTSCTAAATMGLTQSGVQVKSGGPTMRPRFMCTTNTADSLSHPLDVGVGAGQSDGDYADFDAA